MLINQPITENDYISSCIDHNFDGALNLIQWPDEEVQKDNQYIRRGTFNGQEVEDILIDSGAAVSVLASDLLPTNFKREDRVWLAGFGGSPCLYETSMVDVTLGERQFQLRMAVAEREQLRRSAIIGRNVPGMKLADLMLDQAPKDKTPGATTETSGNKPSQQVLPESG